MRDLKSIIPRSGSEMDGRIRPKGSSSRNVSIRDRERKPSSLFTRFRLETCRNDDVGSVSTKSKGTRLFQVRGATYNLRLAMLAISALFFVVSEGSCASHVKAELI